MGRSIRDLARRVRASALVRRYQALGRARWIVNVALLVVIVLGTSGLSLALIHGAQASSATAHASLPKGSDNPKDAGAWFTLSHIGKSHPAPGARAAAMAAAARLPHSTIGTPAPKAKGGPDARYAGTGSRTSTSQSAAVTTSPGGWVPLGPAPISTAQCGSQDPECVSVGDAAGRVPAIAVVPGGTTDFWAGAADGGLWHSSDGGTTWTPVTDGQPTLSIGALAIDPKAGSPYTIYAGTGEADNNGDSYWGDGILKSSDGGQTWSLIGQSQFGGLGIAKIAVDPSNSNNVLVATSPDSLTTPTTGAGASLYTNLGIWRSTDGGATWSEVLTDSANNASHFLAGSDVMFDPANPSFVYSTIVDPYGGGAPVGGNTTPGIYKSTDGGATWGTGPLSNSLPTGLARAKMAMTADGQHIDVVAACDGTGNTTTPSCGKDLIGNPVVNYGELVNDSIYASADGGSTWNALRVPIQMAQDSGGYQWEYEGLIGIDPSDATGNTVYIGGIDLWQTTNGGSTSWTNLSNNYTSSYTLNSGWDNHVVAFVNNTSIFITGSDAGIHEGTISSGNVAFKSLNKGGLNITQFYTGSEGTAGSSGNAQLWGGAQDNGISEYPGVVTENGAAQWNLEVQGDGTGSVVDWNNNNWVYTELPVLGNGNFYNNTGVYTTDNGHPDPNNTGSAADWYCLFGEATDQSGNPYCTSLNPYSASNWVQPLVQSPSKSNELFTADTQVWRTTNAEMTTAQANAATASGGAPSWGTISPVLESGTPISALAVAPSNDNDVYAGDDNGHIFSSINSWSAGTGLSAVSGAMVTGLAVDPTNANVAYATYNEFASGGGEHVYKTTDGGKTWADISASLPNVPFESVVVSPSNHNLVFVGSDAGVFDSPDGGTTWYQTGTGLPNAAIDSIFLNHSGSQLLVATHGRGMWELNIPHIQATAQIVAASEVGSNPSSQTVTISNTGVGNLDWTLGGVPSWLSPSTTTGTVPPGGSQNVTLTFQIPASNPAQTYNASLTVSDPNADNGSVSVPVTAVIASASKQWYFAEGYTGSTFTTLFTVENPGPTAATLTATYNIEGQSNPVVETYTIAAHSRHTINVNSDPKIGPYHGLSSYFSSTVPVVIERPMYYTYSHNGSTVRTGFDTMGATALSSNFDFGYLDSTANHTTLFTVLNPTNAPMYVNMTFYPQNGGTPIAIQTSVIANSRGTVNLTSLRTSPPAGQPSLPAGIYSGQVTLTSDQAGTTPVDGLVERPMYITNSSTGYQQAACVIGVAQPQLTWDFAEGYTGNAGGIEGQFTTNLILAYPTASGTTANANVTVTYMVEGGSPIQKTYQLTPNTLQIVDVNTLVVSNGLSIAVNSDQPILAERQLSFGDGETDVLGTPAGGHEFLFSEGYTASGFTTLFTLQNPNAQVAHVTLTVLPEAVGAQPIVRTYTLQPTSRSTVNINTFYPGQGFSTQIVSDIPIVAERPMYFSDGGTDVIGFQPSGS